MRAGHGLILVVISLLLIGVVMVTSAGLTVGDDSGGTMTLHDLLLGRSALFAALAVALLLLGCRIPIGRVYSARGLASPIPWIVIGSIVLLILVHVPGIGLEVNGARRWIRLGPLGFQPSEVAKWGLLIVLAWHAARRVGSMGDFRSGFLAPMALIAVICALIVTEDLGTAVLIGMVGTLMILAGGARLRHVALLVPFAAAGFAAAILSSPYRIDRLRAFLDPYQDPQGIGYHVLQSMAAVSGGGLPGRGLGNGLQKFGYLPEDTTDFIFAIICEELGIVGAAVVIGLYATLLLCGLSIIRRAMHPFPRLLGLGILLTIGLQALMNLMVVTGLAPTKGIALPLLSSGGTGWCLTAFCVGLLVSMDREHAREKAAWGDSGAPAGESLSPDHSAEEPHIHLIGEFG
ncbi:MAG: FtsW/RodA/SpoVE family cell cycle protein [Planctomycetota bacterium]|nr:FtsW/RodA/SpoVE family cell cycle protein [Planctomycetota bacterium]